MRVDRKRESESTPIRAAPVHSKEKREEGREKREEKKEKREKREKKEKREKREKGEKRKGRERQYQRVPESAIMEVESSGSSMPHAVVFIRPINGPNHG